ncbi:MAG: signal recognition particle-docking protein FtsY, partial [Chloroflexi bacterium]|nr:signal recognition particle-docking protein FtsY [Chloroflexota bacterium]
MVRFFRRKEKVDAGLKKTREGWFGRVAKLLDRAEVGEEVWEALEEALISADAGATLAMSLLATVKDQAATQRVRTGEGVRGLLQDEMLRILGKASGAASPLVSEAEPLNLPAKPYVILVIGVNGVGKTTSIAKLAKLLSDDGKKVLFAAADTFRAAAIEQLDIWADRTGAEIVAHQHGADPGAVTFDALQAARSRGADVVIVDTAGRLHTKTNLMEELKKIHRVIRRFDKEAPHETILVIDATTGQNGLAQAEGFEQAVGVTGLFLAKLDGTARGGVALAIADRLHMPILFIGTGEGLDDIAPFHASDYVEGPFS